MKGKRAGWWVATAIGAALAVATAVVRARGDEGRSRAYEAGEIVGSVLGPVLLAALVAFIVVRFAKVDGYWALPVVLAAATALNVVLVLARAGQEAAERNACADAEVLQVETLVPGAPYRARPLDEATQDRIAAGFRAGGAEVNATQVVDTRDRAAFVLVAATSTGELIRDVDVFAGFARRPGGTLEETEMGGRPARAARRQGGTTIIATTGECSIVTLAGIEDGATRDLATALRLDP